MNATNATNATIDEAIDRVEQLYTTLTGARPPHVNGHSAPIPPESDPLVHVEEQFARMMAVVAQLVPGARPAVTWTPRAAVWRDEDGLALAIEIPGMTREQIRIDVDRGVLTVSGDRQPPWARARGVRSVDGCDAGFGSFSRSFALPVPVASEHVNARLDQGVLTIRISTVRGDASQIQIRS